MDKQNKIPYSDSPAFLREFLFYMQTIKGRSIKTVNAYYIDLRTFFRYLKRYKLNNSPADVDFAKIDISDLTLDAVANISLVDIYEFLNFTLTERSNDSKARARKVSSIRALYKYLTTVTGKLQNNPTKSLDTPSIKKSVPKYLTLEDAIQLLNSVGKQFYERDYCILVLFLNCGMRLSELVGINLGDIRDNTVKLLGKGNKERIIYLNDACIAAINAYKTVRNRQKTIQDKQALFLSSNGLRLSPRRVEQIVAECLKNAGLANRGYSPHKLRHTAATLMYQHGGVDIRILKEILGHANVGTTEIYTHISSVQMEKAAHSSPLSKVKVSPSKPDKNNTQTEN